VLAPIGAEALRRFVAVAEVVVQIALGIVLGPMSWPSPTRTP